MILPRGTWSVAHRAPALLAKRVRPDRPLVLRRHGDGALALPALRQDEWFYAVVSHEDDWACAWNWFVAKNGYVQRNHNKRTEYLHRLVMVRVLYPEEFDAAGIALGDVELAMESTTTVDHRNRNQLDSTRRNLRMLTQSDQNRNQGRNDRDDVGVTWDAARGRWMAIVKHLGRDHFVGRFRSRHAAIARREQVLRDLLGRAAVTA